jgi:hypothetical protein
MPRNLLASILVMACLAGVPAGAARIEGVEFADRRLTRGTALRLQGVGLLRYRIFLKGYVAALYLGEDVEAGAALDDVPRRLEIEYFWKIPAQAFVEVTKEGLARVVDEATFERFERSIEQLNGLYRDVRPGDRYALNYFPGVGTELEYNGEVQGLIEGAEFSSALFGIWLGDQALDDSLREQLLSEG